MVLERNSSPIIYLSRWLICYLIMSVCSTSHADMLYVNRIYVCIVNMKLENTYGLWNPTYMQCPYPSHLCHGAIFCARLGTLSWPLRILVSAAGMGICGFPLPVAARVLEWALPHQAAFQLGTHTVKVAEAGVCPGPSVVHTVRFIDVILHLCYVQFDWSLYYVSFT